VGMEKPKGKKQLGRPVSRWEDNNKRVILKKRQEGVVWIQVAWVKVHWRDLVTRERRISCPF